MAESQEELIQQQKQQCPFCKIISGSVPSKKVYEDEKILAILDINPAANGHMLVMPKEHYPIAPLIPPETFEHLFVKVKELSAAARRAMPCLGISIFIANGAAAGQQSSHFMVHLVPRDPGDGLSTFDIEKRSVMEQKVDEIASVLEQNLPLMVTNHLRRWHTPGVEPKTRSFTRQEVIAILEKNPKLMQIVSDQPEVLKEEIKRNEQLKMLFSQVDVDELSEELNAAKKSREGKAMPPKKDDDVLDKVSRMMGV